MKFNEFAASFRTPEEKISWSGTQFQGPSGDVVIAGTVLATGHSSCIIDVNGAQYEIPAGDVSDIEIVLTPSTGKGASEESTKGVTPQKGSGKEKKEETDTPKAPPVVLVKVNRNAILCRRVPVQAAMVAAIGTWVNVIPPAGKPVEQPPAKSA